jgi:hypothetical protein
MGLCLPDIKHKNFCSGAIDPAAVLTKILSNGECGCRGEDGNQSRLNASANLERPVQNRPFGFFSHKKAHKAQKQKSKKQTKANHR